jgi:hypothetical protein
MSYYLEVILPTIGVCVILVLAGFCAELVNRSYKNLRALSRDTTQVFPWLTHGWLIIRGLLNMNFGSILFLTLIWCAFNLQVHIVFESVWSDMLVTILYIMMFVSAYKTSAEKMWKLF